jgi:hypothetical protein
MLTSRPPKPLLLELLPDLSILPSVRRKESSPKEPKTKFGIGNVWCLPPPRASGSAGAPSTSFYRVGAGGMVRKNTKFKI